MSRKPKNLAGQVIAKLIREESKSPVVFKETLLQLTTPTLK